MDVRHLDEHDHLSGRGQQPQNHEYATAAFVQSATSAPPSAAAEQSRRIRRYLIAMGFRALCGVMAYFTMGWVRWTLVAAAVILPYIAVVLANAVGPRSGSEIAPIDSRVRALDAEPQPGTYPTYPTVPSYSDSTGLPGDTGAHHRPTIHGNIVDGGAPS